MTIYIKLISIISILLFTACSKAKPIWINQHIENKKLCEIANTYKSKNMEKISFLKAKAKLSLKINTYLKKENISQKSLRNNQNLFINIKMVNQYYDQENEIQYTKVCTKI